MKDEGGRMKDEGGRMKGWTMKQDRIRTSNASVSVSEPGAIATGLLFDKDTFGHRWFWRENPVATAPGSDTDSVILCKRGINVD
jgi:hypothetical protein